MEVEEQWESFHQQEDLTTRLHNILEEYPAGIGIFKEFLQNADDAGARKFAIVWDRHSYCDRGRDGLLAPSMNEWQGPAVYVYNDATFSDEDFESISHVGRSGKQDDAAKIGKYGLGFNCAYHFTDVVSFITRDQLVIFDPHGKHLPNGLLGMRCNFIEKRLCETHPAQVAPFTWGEDSDSPDGESNNTFSDALAFNPVNLRQPLDGTLFRLPLRSAKQAEESAIVNHTFEDDDLFEMLNDFANAASAMLLFLKNVEEIEIYIRHDPNSTTVDTTVGADKGGVVVERLARTWIDLGIGDPNSGAYTDAESSARNTMREMRSRCSQQAKPPADLGKTSQQESCTYELRLRDERNVDATRSVDEETWMLHWTDGHVAGNDSVSAALGAGRAIAQGLGLNEWVAVAIPLGCSRHGKVVGHHATNPLGRAYCFLPLPIETGLHVHVHAAFALSSNRRDLWVAHDAAGAGALKAQWNQHLLQLALPTCFAEALNLLPDHLDAAAVGSSFSRLKALVLYSALPDLAMVKSPFEELAIETFRMAAKKDCRLVYDDADSRKPWVRLSEAVFQDESFARIFASEANNKIRQLLARAEDLRLVSPPAFVCNSLLKANVPIVTTAPAMVAGILKTQKINLSRGQAGSVLAYLLEGYRTRKDVFKQLMGIKVAPLHNNELGTFQARTNCSQFFFLCPTIPLHDPTLGASDGSTTGDVSTTMVDGRSLMPDFPFFLDPDAPIDALEALSSKQCLGQLNIVHLNLRGLASHMDYVLPAAWRNTHAPISLALNDTRIETDDSDTHSCSSLIGGGALSKHEGKKKRGSRHRRRAQQQQTAAADLPSGADVLERLKLFWAFVDRCGERVDVDRSFSGWPIVTACRYGKNPQVIDQAGTDGSCTQSGDQITGQESPVLQFVMSIDVARSYHAVSRELYTADELRVLDQYGVMFLTGAAERLTVHIQGTEKVNPALRAVARYFSGNSQSRSGSNDLLGNATTHQSQCEIHYRSELRDLVLRWSGEEDAMQKANNPQGRSRVHRRRPPPKQHESVPQTVLRQLPIFELLDGNWVSPSSSMGVGCPPSSRWEALLRRHASGMPCLSSEGKAGQVLRCAGLEDKNEEEFLGMCVAPWLLKEGTSAAAEICIAFIEGVERCSRMSSIWKRRQERNPRAMLMALDEAPLVKCVDGVRRLINECMDPDDPDLRVIYGNNDSAELYPMETYRTPEILKVLRHAGMSSLGDGESFCKAVEHIARQPCGLDRGPTAPMLAGARHLLSYLASRSPSQLNWSNEHFSRVASEEWAPAQDWSLLPLPPDSSLRLLTQKRRETAAAALSEERGLDSRCDSGSDGEEQQCDPPLSVQTIRERVGLVYQKKNPVKQREVGKLMKKYRGREMVLYRAILRKYDVTPEYFRPGGDGETEGMQSAMDHQETKTIQAIENSHGYNREHGEATYTEQVNEPWQLVTLDSCILRSAAPLAWTELLVLDSRGDGLGAALASRLRCCGAQPAPEIIATHLSRVTAAAARNVDVALNSNVPNPTKASDEANDENADATILPAVMGSTPTIDLSQTQNVWRCQAVIQQCALALAKACKKGSRATRATLTAILGEAPFVLVGSGETDDGGNGLTINAQALPVFIKSRHLCLDIEGGDDLGPTARAVPYYMQGARPLLELLGTPSALEKPKGAPLVVVRAPPPSLGVHKWVTSQFNQPALADVKFELAAGGVIYAHRLVLASVSPYFQHMFLGEMAAARGVDCTAELPVRIELPDWASREAVVMLLSNLYSGGALNSSHDNSSGVAGVGQEPMVKLEKSNPESFEIVLGLLRLADMMACVYAKEWAEEWLASSDVLDIWNVCTMLTHADSCSAHQLRALCVHHIQKTFKLVERTEEWQELSEDLKLVRALAGRHVIHD